MHKTLAIFVLNLFLLSGATAFLGACNTAAGVGEDISATGNAHYRRCRPKQAALKRLAQLKACRKIQGESA